MGACCNQGHAGKYRPARAGLMQPQEYTCRCVAQSSDQQQVTSRALTDDIRPPPSPVAPHGCLEPSQRLVGRLAAQVNREARSEAASQQLHTLRQTHRCRAGNTTGNCNAYAHILRWENTCHAIGSTRQATGPQRTPVPPQRQWAHVAVGHT
jgi:hypothetical protein